MPCQLHFKPARWAALLAALAMTAPLDPNTSQAGEPSAQARMIHELVMDHMKGYDQLEEPKVMAICIDWQADNEAGFFIHNAFVTYTSMASDVQVFIGKLVQDAKFRCKQWRKAEKIDCSCRMLDKNGKNVLKVPSGG